MRFKKEFAKSLFNVTYEDKENNCSRIMLLQVIVVVCGKEIHWMGFL